MIVEGTRRVPSLGFLAGEVQVPRDGNTPCALAKGAWRRSVGGAGYGVVFEIKGEPGRALSGLFRFCRLAPVFCGESFLPLVFAPLEFLTV